MTLRFSLLGLIGFTTLAALASATLVQPGVGWTSLVVSLTAGMLAWQVLRLLLTTGPSRAAAAGWLLFAIGYLAIVFAPSTDTRLAPHLLSSKLLAYAQTHWHKMESSGAPVQQWLDWNGRVNINSPNALIFDSTGNTLWSDGAWGGVSLLHPVTVNPVPPGLCFQLTGHWLCAWLAGWIGAVLAVQFQRRRQTVGGLAAKSAVAQ
jgi:hypothetical protein